MEKMLECQNYSLCDVIQAYQDITGNQGSPQAADVSINSDFRSAIIHLTTVFTNETQSKSLYSLGSNSYFSESAYIMDDWKTRYWGDKYEKLLAIKQKYDPKQRFQCYHCVGSDQIIIPPSKPALTKLQIGLIAGGCGILIISVSVFIFMRRKKNKL